MNGKESPVIRLAHVGRWLTGAGLAGLAIVYLRALWFTPLERFQGPAQKIFYVHVPAAWMAMVAFGLAGAMSLVVLVSKSRRADLLAGASAEVGIVFSLVVLSTGPLWGRPIWGVWWAWDARLTVMLILFVLFVGYLGVRRLERGVSRGAALVAVVALPLIPLNHLAVRLFRTIHPGPVVLREGGPALPPTMQLTLLLGVATFALLFAGFLLQRYAVMRNTHLGG